MLLNERDEMMRVENTPVDDDVAQFERALGKGSIHGGLRNHNGSNQSLYLVPGID